MLPPKAVALSINGAGIGSAHVRQAGGGVALQIHAKIVRLGAGRSLSRKRGSVASVPDSERLFERILEASPDALVIVDQDGKITLVNAQAEAMFGYVRKDLIDKPIEILIPERFLTRHGQHRQGYFAAPTVRPMGAGARNLWARRRDGTAIPVEISLSPLETEGGTVAMAAIRDVSERRQMEDALRVAEEPYQLLVQNIQDYAIFLMDARGHILNWNAGAERIKGYPAEEIVGEHFSLFYPAEDIQCGKPAQELRAAAAEGRYEDEGWRIRKDGSRFWANVILTPVRARNGELQAFSEITRDLTERKHAELLLAESEERFRTIAELTPHLLWTGEANGKISYANNAFEAYMGTVEETYHRLIDRVHPNDVERTASALKRAADSGEPYEIEHQIRRADGVYRWHLNRGRPTYDEAGRLARWYVSLIDIHERREMGAELEQRVHERTVQLQVVNQELEAFSYSVSHDLRAPLRHIDGYVEMLAKDMADRLSPNSARYLDTVKRASRQMGQLIDDLLAFSRMGKNELQERAGDLDGLIRDTIGALEIETRGRDIVWIVPPLPVIMGDPTMLKQVFANLLANAIKYTGPRDTARIEIGVAGEEDGRTVLFVRDNGVGFDMKYAGKLFGVFQRLHRADQFPGTGVGLATVRRIIARHGGRTWAEAALDKGATFYFTLRPAASLKIQ